VDDQLESLGQQRLQHRPHHIGSEWTFRCLGDDVETIGAYPVRSADDLGLLHVERLSKQQPQRHVGGVETPSRL
jgi:hypothetical protein